MPALLRARRLPAALRLDEETLRPLRRRDPMKVALHTVTSVAAFVACGLLTMRLQAGWARPLIWLVQGFLLSCFFDAAHECIHGYYAGSSRWNRVAGTLWLLPVLVNYPLYRRYHLQHHRFTRVLGDPEPSGTFRHLGDYLLCFPLAAVISPLKWSIDAAFGRLPPYASAPPIRREIRAGTIALGLWLAAALALTFIAPRAALNLYWGPLAFVYPIAFTTVLLEHHDCDHGDSFLGNTRTMDSNFVFRLLVWNGNYHAEHHAYPSVPAHNLPRLHALLAPHFRHREPSYAAFHLRLVRALLSGQTSPPNSTGGGIGSLVQREVRGQMDHSETDQNRDEKPET